MPSDFTPHEYQERAIRTMLSQQSVGLFLDPGLGKTVITLSAFDMLQEHGEAERMLIVAPLRVMYSTWPTEIAAWGHTQHLQHVILHGKDKNDRATFDADIYIINPEGLPWLIECHPGLIRSCDVLCVDESSKFKNTRSKRFKMLRDFLPGFKRRWALTGTPTPNGMEDLFGQVYLLDLGGALGKYITHYRNQFFYQTGYGGYEYKLMPGAFDQITHKVAPLVVQMSAEDYLDMPELFHVKRHVELPAKAQYAYSEVEKEFLVQLESGTVVAANAAAAGTKCRQIANGAVYTEGDEWEEIHKAKLEALEELVEELGGAPLLLLYEFQHDAERIVQAFPEARSITGVSAASAQMEIDRFNAGGTPILLGHPASMGHGLNLQGSCHHVAWFGIPWNLEHYDQAIARVYRQGQQADTVFVYHLMAKDTLDEVVLDVLRAKDRTQNQVLKALELAR